MIGYHHFRLCGYLIYQTQKTITFGSSSSDTYKTRMRTSSALLFFVYLACVGSDPTSKYGPRHNDAFLVEDDFGHERYEELVEADFSMSMSMSMSMSFDYGGRQKISSRTDGLQQPVLFDSIVPSSAPTAQVTMTLSSVGSVGSVDVSVREVVVEKEAAVTAGTLGGRRRNGDSSDHPNIFVVLSITVGTVVVVAVIARKIYRLRGRNTGSDLPHSAMATTVSECV